MRKVRGVLFVDHVRMARRLKPGQLEPHLLPQDKHWLGERVQLDAWYPMDAFERLGRALLDELVGTERDAIQLWGRAQLTSMLELVPELLVPDDPRETITRFALFIESFFDFPAVSVRALADDAATIAVDFGLSAPAEEAAALQTLGFFESLVEEAGGRDLTHGYTSATWKGAPPPSLLTLGWQRRLVSQPSPVPTTARAARLLLIDDEPLVLSGLQRLMRKWADVTCVSSVRDARTTLEALSFDVVICDHLLGEGVTGLVFLEEVARRWPETGRILHSGYAPDGVADATARGVLHSVARKPLLPSELRRLAVEAQVTARATRPLLRSSDASRPVQVVHLHYASAPTDDELAEKLAAATAAWSPGGPQVLLVESAPEVSLTRPQRERQDAWLQEQAAHLRRSCLAMAFVVPDPLSRLGSSALLRARPFPVPAAVFATAEEARTWLETVIAPRRIAAP